MRPSITIKNFIELAGPLQFYKLGNALNPAMIIGNKICAKKHSYEIRELKNPKPPIIQTNLSAFQSKGTPLSDAYNGF